MVTETLASHARLAAHTARLCGRFALRRMHQSRLLRWRYNGPAIDHLLIAPQDLRTADPSFASETYHGQFGLAGAVARTGSRSPFLVRPPSRAWLRELHGFGWLLHLRAVEDEIAREQARALVRDWIVLHDTIAGEPWLPEVVARRVISWLSHSAIVLQNAEGDYYEMVMESLARQMRYLRATHRDVPQGAPRVLTLTALVLAGLCAAEQEAYAEQHLPAFSAELERQVLPDGGHVSRDPSALIELLLDLLPLRHCFLARDRQPPQALAVAIDRMMPMLRFFRLGDGNMARFNGMSATPSDLLATLLAYDDVQGTPVNHAVHSGYLRAERGASVLIADLGRPPPAELSGAAHAGCLSFELGSGRDPVIVNCGAPGLVEGDWRAAGRSTAAHSTVTVCDTSSSRFLPSGLAGGLAEECRLAGPFAVEAHIAERDGGLEIVASHDGYEGRFGIVHTRRLTLSASGEYLEGEDRLTAPRGLSGAAASQRGAFVARFHLHPSVRAQMSLDGATALLITPGHECWLLTSRSGALSIEESIFLADPKGPRRTLQVAIAGRFDGGEAAVAWTMERSVARLAPDSASARGEAAHGLVPRR